MQYYYGSPVADALMRHGERRDQMSQFAENTAQRTHESKMKAKELEAMLEAVRGGTPMSAAASTPAEGAAGVGAGAAEGVGGAAAAGAEGAAGAGAGAAGAGAGAASGAAGAGAGLAAGAGGAASGAAGGAGAGLAAGAGGAAGGLAALLEALPAGLAAIFACRAAEATFGVDHAYTNRARYAVNVEWSNEARAFYMKHMYEWARLIKKYPPLRWIASGIFAVIGFGKPEMLPSGEIKG